MNMHSATQALVALTMLIGLAGCAAGAAATLTPNTAPSSAPTTGPAAGATPAPTPAATVTVAHAPAGRTMFSGTADCGIEGETTSVTDGNVTTFTGTLSCALTTSDPRVIGTDTGEITMAYLEMPGYKVNRWWSSEPWTLTTAEGSWRSTEAFGTDAWDEHDVLRTTGREAHVGEGAYAGLRMRMLYAQGTSEPVDAYVVAGWIEPVE